MARIALVALALFCIALPATAQTASVRTPTAKPAVMVASAFDPLIASGGKSISTLYEVSEMALSISGRGLDPSAILKGHISSSTLASYYADICQRAPDSARMAQCFGIVAKA